MILDQLQKLEDELSQSGTKLHLITIMQNKKETHQEAVNRYETENGKILPEDAVIKFYIQSGKQLDEYLQKMRNEHLFIK